MKNYCISRKKIAVVHKLLLFGTTYSGKKVKLQDVSGKVQKPEIFAFLKSHFHGEKKCLFRAQCFICKDISMEKITFLNSGLKPVTIVKNEP